MAIDRNGQQQGSENFFKIDVKMTVFETSIRAYHVLTR